MAEGVESRGLSDDEGAGEAVGGIGGGVSVVHVGADGGGAELVLEGGVGGLRALREHGRAVHEGGLLLGLAAPVDGERVRGRAVHDVHHEDVVLAHVQRGRGQRAVGGEHAAHAPVR